jgi:Pro-kumamolisin, activation domain
MDNSTLDLPTPDGYVRLAGSERSAPAHAKFLGAAPESETFSVTIVLRRRADGPPMPDFDYFTKTPPRRRQRFSSEEFTAKYGAHPDDIHAVSKFATDNGLEVTKAHAGRRHVVLTGTPSQFSRAFGVSFSYFEVPARKAIPSMPVSGSRKYRDYAGFIHVPADLSDAIVGVFGLDNAPIGSRANNPGDPTIVTPVTVQQVTQLYNFPAPGAAIGGQTIGIISPVGVNGGGYLQSDLDLTFSSVGLTAPIVIPLSVEPGVTNATYATPTTAAAASGATALQFASTSNINPYMSASYTYCSRSRSPQPPPLTSSLTSPAPKTLSRGLPPRYQRAPSSPSISIPKPTRTSPSRPLLRLEPTSSTTSQMTPRRDGST